MYAGLLGEVNMLMVEQAKSAMLRSSVLIDEALQCRTVSLSPDARAQLVEDLRKPLVDDLTAHSATVGPKMAQEIGLPIRIADVSSSSWQTLWSLWARYFEMGCWPVGPVAIYEGHLASQRLGPDHME